MTIEDAVQDNTSRRVFTVHRVGARKVFPIDVMLDANFDPRAWSRDIASRLTQKIEHCVSDAKRSIVGPITVDLVFEVMAEAIDDAAGLGEHQRWDVWQSGKHQVEILRHSL